MPEDAEATQQQTPSIDNPAQETAAPTSAADLATVRELVIKANPDVVPELVAGASISELQASVEPARAAYQRIAEAARGAGTAAATAAVKVPAGTVPTVVDVEQLSSAEKIRRGLANRPTA